MKKILPTKYYVDLGKYLTDMSKVIATSVVIAPFVKNDFFLDVRIGIIIIIGVTAAVALLWVGLFLSNYKK